MPDPRSFTVAQELQFLNEVQQMQYRNEQFRRLISPNLSLNAGSLILRAPYAPKEVIMPVARGITDGLMTQDQGGEIVDSTQRKVLTSPVTYKFDGPSLWDNIFGGIKTAVKWTGGVASLPYDVVSRGIGSVISSGIQAANIPSVATSNIIQTGSALPDLTPDLTSQYIAQQQMAPVTAVIGAPELGRIESVRGMEFTAPNNGTLVDWWRSTQLGALTSGQPTGSGWFVGDRAAKLMNESALKVSGGIAGMPMTLGTGLSLTVSRPGTKPYAIMSGLTDMALGFAIPAAVPKTLGGRIASVLGDIDINVAGQEVRPLLRSFAGLTNFEMPYVVKDKAIQFLDSATGKWLIEKLASENRYSRIAKWFPETDITFRQAIVDATTPDKVRSVLEDQLGFSRGLTNVEDFNLTRWSDMKQAMFHNGLARWTGVERLASSRGGQEIALLDDDILRQTQGVENLSSYLTTLKVAPEKADELINELASTLVNDPGNIKPVYNKIIDTVAEGIANNRRGVTKEAAAGLMKQYSEIRDQYILYGLVNNDLQPEIFALSNVPFEGITQGDGAKSLFTIPTGTAMSTAEQMRRGIYLPNHDRIYRATSAYNWVFEKGSILNRYPKLGEVEKIGQARLPIVAADWLVNRVFKTAATMTGGFILRALGESLVRESLAPGLKLGPFHPFEHIRTAAMTDGFGKYIGDIEGLPFAEYAEGIIKQGYQDSADLVAAVSRGRFDPRMLELKAAQTGTWVPVTRGMDTYPQMLMDNIQLLSNDEIYRMVAQNLTNEQIIYEMKQAGSTAELALKRTQQRYSNITLYNTQTNQYEKATITFIDAAGNVNEDAVNKFIDNYVRQRIHYVTGGQVRQDGTIIANGHPSLIEIIANGDRLGGFEMDGRQFRAYKTALKDVDGQLTAIDYSDEFKQLIKNVLDDPEFGPRMPVTGKARNNVAINGLFSTPKSEMTKVADTMVTRFFSVLYGKPDTYLNRSPVWRQFYYWKVDDLLDHIAPGEAAYIRDAVLEARGYQAKELLKKLKKLTPDAEGNYDLGWRKANQEQFDALFANTQAEVQKAISKADDGWGARYVGNKATWKKINDLADGKLPSRGEYTAREISDAARAFAADETRSTLYNASRSNNFGQVMRIVAPFGPAWAEFWQNLGRTILRAPTNIEKTKNAFVLADGMRGFFGTDPVTGEPVFNYFPTDISLPMILGMAGVGIGTLAGGVPGAVVGGYLGAKGGQQVAEKVSPVNPELVSPAKALNVGLNIFPGVSPVVQIAANAILPDKPSTDWVRNILLPYGPAQNLLGVMPSWANKLSEAITADPETDRVYAAVRMDAFIALMASGNYDRTDNNQIGEAWRKAAEIGRYLTVARSIGQLVGPGRPGVQMKIPSQFEGQISIEDVNYLVKDGNVPNVIAARVFRQLQKEDITTAVPRFIEMFGENFMYYVAGRTKAEVGGLDASKEFNDWERNNQAFADDHENVYGWFAPTGAEFSKQAFIRQVTTGRRSTRQDPYVLVRDTEYIVASSLYRNYVKNNQPNTNPDGSVSKEEKDRITDLYKAYRTTLKQVFPGYDYKAFDANATATRIKEVIAAANDSRVSDNVVAQAIQAYSDFRDSAIAIANSPERRPNGPVTSNMFGGNKNADLRSALREFGESIAIANPEFQRVWDDVFYYEVDEVGT